LEEIPTTKNTSFTAGALVNPYGFDVFKFSCRFETDLAGLVLETITIIEG
jgi:hypothetical protein